MGSDVTGETLTTAMDFLIPTTTDRSTLHFSFKETSTITESVTIQTSDTSTVSPETQLACYVHLHQDAETGIVTSKDTNTSRDVMEKQCQDLILLNEKINNLEKEAVEKIWEFIEGKEENIGQIALHKYTQFLQDLEEYVNRSEEAYNLVRNQKTWVYNRLTFRVKNKLKDKYLAAVRTNYTVENLFILININAKYKALIDLVPKNHKEYGETYEVSLLEDNLKALIDIVHLLNKHIQEAKKLINLRESLKLTPVFQSNYTESLVDFKIWESELENQIRNLVECNKLLRDEKFTLLLQKYIYPVTQGVILLVGCWGNGVLLAVFVMHKDMRTPPNHMVINLAVGDSLSLISNILIPNIVNVSGGTWHYGLALCKIYRFVRHLCLGVTVYSIVVISAQRFFALRVFFKWHGFGCRLKKKYKSLLTIAFVWLLASVVALPRPLGAEVYHKRCYAYGWNETDDYYSWTTLIDLVALCFVPLVIIVVLSGATARRFVDGVKDMPGEAMGMQNVMEARLLSSKILIYLAVVFAVCYVPYFLYAFLRAWFKFIVDNSTDQWIPFFIFSLIFGNSCFNPIVVYFASSKYRLHMNKYLFCKCRQQVDMYSRKFSNETSVTEETQI